MLHALHEQIRHPQTQEQVPRLGVLTAELRAGRAAILAAGAKLHRVVGPPLAADLALARLDVAKARADLRVAQSGRGDAVLAAQLSVASAERRLQTLDGTPDPIDAAAAQLELAKAVLDQETLVRRQPAPSAAAIGAADLTIALAQQHVADALAGGTAADLAAGRAELAKAQSEREALVAPPAPVTDAARAAAGAAVLLAQRRLDAVSHPPAAILTSARADVSRARADLASLRAARGSAAADAAAAGLIAARSRLSAVGRRPRADIVAAARLEVRRSRADLALLRQRGAPASATDLALARLKLHVAQQRSGLALRLASRLTVRAAATGVVTGVLTTPGAAVDPATPLLRVQDLDHLVVALNLSEFDVGRTRVGVPSLISVDALGGRQYGARVADIAAGGIDNGGVVNFPVIITLNTIHRQLRPGMSVSARLIVRRRRSVVRVPLAAVAGDGAHACVTVRTAGGRLQRRAVHLGLSGKEFVEVRSGLSPGEHVLVPSAR